MPGSYADLLREAEARKQAEQRLADAESLCERLGDALYVAYTELGEDPDGARNWRELFLPLTPPSWSEVMRSAVRDALKED